MSTKIKISRKVAEELRACGLITMAKCENAGDALTSEESRRIWGKLVAGKITFRDLEIKQALEDTK